jgi:hypothetical protein
MAFAGDMTHLLSIVTLLLKIHATKSCAGVSMRTQELYAMVFVARYLDLFFNFISFYNTVMKLIFISSSFTILWYMRRHKVVSQTYDKEQVREKMKMGLCALVWSIPRGPQGCGTTLVGLGSTSIAHSP